jgi:hypothetical protein
MDDGRNKAFPERSRSFDRWFQPATTVDGSRIRVATRGIEERFERVFEFVDLVVEQLDALNQGAHGPAGAAGRDISTGRSGNLAQAATWLRP